MKAILVELKPYDPATDTTPTLRATNVNDPSVTLVSGGPGEFLPILCSGPVIARTLFNGDFSGGGTAPGSELSLRLDEGDLDKWIGYVWGDAEVTIRQGVIGAAYSAYELMWTVRSVSIQRNGNVVRVQLKPPAELNRPLLYRSFAGTDDGDSGDTGEGRVEVRGTLKPWLSGSARFVRPVLIDGARQIYCYHGYGPTGGATAAFEGGVDKLASSFTWSTYAAMRDEVMTSDQWGCCPSIGMIRLGGQPSFPITIHVEGDKPSGTLLTSTADIIKRMLEGPAGVVAPAIAAANVTEMNNMRGEAIDYYATSQITVEKAITDLMVSANGYWLENETGKIILGLITPELQGHVAGAPPPETDNDLPPPQQDVGGWNPIGVTSQVIVRSFRRVRGGYMQTTVTTVVGEKYHFRVDLGRLDNRAGGSENSKLEIINGAETYTVTVNSKTGAHTSTGVANPELNVVVMPAGDSYYVGINFTALVTTVTLNLHAVA